MYVSCILLSPDSKNILYVAMINGLRRQRKLFPLEASWGPKHTLLFSVINIAVFLRTVAPCLAIP